MNTPKHLPLSGAGPVYVTSISLLTLVALVLHYKGWLPTSILPPFPLFVFKIAAGILVVSGIIIWSSAVFGSKVTRNVKENHLITDGVYGIVRHPIYTAFTLAEWGLLLYTGNLWFLLLIPLYWIYFTLLIKNTEEKWLRQLYGEEYERYCKKVNRCIPWFPQRESGKRDKK